MYFSQILNIFSNIQYLIFIHRKTAAIPGGMVLKLQILTHLQLLEFNALILGDVFSVTRISIYL